MTPLSRVVLYESIQLGPKATSSIDINDPNEFRRRDWAGTTMSLEETSGLITVVFRGRKKFLHISACRYADALELESAPASGGHTVTHYNPNAQDDGDPDEFDDPPPAPKKKKPGRPAKAKASEADDDAVDD